MLKAKVRGIYSTALTKLLLDNGFEIVQPSAAIRKRFNIEENQSPPDLQINDSYDLQGVRVLGSQEAVTAFQSVLHSAFADVLTRKWQVHVDGIYKGNVLNSNDETFYVELCNGVVGELPRGDVSADAKQVIVQVERKRIGSKHPVLTTKLNIVGKYAILTKTCKVGVSFKIRDLSKRAELYALGKKFASVDWGIIWRETSAHQPTEVLENEIETLRAKAEALDESAQKAVAPSLLVEGLCFMSVEFPAISKSQLDKLRASLVPTVDGHHFYKSCGGKVSVALEMAEKLLEKGHGLKDVKELFEKQIATEFPEVGSIVDVFHVKPSGRVLHIGQAVIENLSGNQIKYSRTIRTNGFYDGLGVVKEAGDTAVSETEIGAWWISTQYYSQNGALKGTYINVNTPVEVYPKAIRYVDLEVDICIYPDGTVKVLDVDKLEKALEKGVISKSIFENVKSKVEEIVKNARNATKVLN
jgi:Ribonuclease G/E